MKNHKISKLKWMIVIFSLATLFGTIACEKKPGQASAEGYGVYAPGCVNCFPNPQSLLTGVRTVLASEPNAITINDNLQLTLDVLAPATGFMNWFDPKAPVYYSGLVAVRGIFSIRGSDATICFAPAGNYSVSTVQTGYMTALTLSGIRLDAVGPNGNHLIMTLTNGIIYNANGVSSQDIGGNRIGVTLRLDSVNGVPCGMISI
jgi:hypothetical protein